MILRKMMRAPVMCLGGIFMAIQKDQELSLILLGILPVIFLIILLVSRRAIPLFKTIQKKIDQLNLVLRENLIGIRIIRAFGRVGYEKKRFASANAELTNTSVKVNRIMAILNPVMMLSMNLLSIGIIWFASFRIDAGSLQIGDMMAFIQYAMQIFMSLMMLTMMFVMLPRALASAERIQEVLSVEPEVVDPKKPITTTEKKGIVFNNVTFRYKKAENPSVCNISFTANRGETVAIIGGTGSGKSTLLNLLLRAYDVVEGEVLVDGVDVRKLSQKDLRDKIGYVPQHAVLFSGTINDNIRIGKQNATQDEIYHACEVAQASEFIEQLPDKYESYVAQGGTNFSGGQKQRLSIARAIVRKPEIYVFDDSFSALDFNTDAKLRAALKDEVKEAIVIIIAQRVSSIMSADKILVMDNGRIIGSGTHQELFQTNAVYKEIVLSQLSEKEVI
jgi:ATP-binding cassette subfamily B protein